MARYKQLCLHFRLPVRETKGNLKGVTPALIPWQQRAKGGQKGLQALLFLIFLSTPVHTLPHTPTSAPPPLCSQHAYNCHSLKFNSASCLATQTPPCSHHFYTHTELPASFWVIQPPLWSPHRLSPFQCPLKPTGLANSGPRPRDPKRRKKRASPALKSTKKSMASFMTARLSSARCEGGYSNPPLPTVKDGEGDRKWVGERSSSHPYLLEAFYQGVGSLVIFLFFFSWYMLPPHKTLRKSNHLCCCKLLCRNLEDQ